MTIRSLYIWPVAMWRWVDGLAGEWVSGDRNYARNYLTGSSGNDTIVDCGIEYTKMIGGAGDDWLFAGPCGHTDLYGGVGNDWLQGNGGADYLNGEQGNDTILGMGGDDRITDFYGNNRINGNDGNDTIHTRDGVQIIWGDAGADKINAENAQGGSELHGGVGNDEMSAYGVNCEVYGDEGNDTIRFTSYGSSWPSGSEVYGGTGDDAITLSGSYIDVEGGAGKDTIDFTNGDHIIAHYNSFDASPKGRSDILKHFGDVSTNKVDVSSLESAGVELFWAGDSRNHSAGAVYLQNNWTNSVLYVYGSNNAVLELTFNNSAHLTRDMFLI